MILEIKVSVFLMSQSHEGRKIHKVLFRMGDRWRLVGGVVFTARAQKIAKKVAKEGSMT